MVFKSTAASGKWEALKRRGYEAYEEDSKTIYFSKPIYGTIDEWGRVTWFEGPQHSEELDAF